MARIRCGRLDRLRICRSATRLSCSLLRAGSWRGSACFRSALTPSSGFGALLRRLRTVWREGVQLDLRAVGLQPVPHHPGPVSLEPVHDEERLAPGVPDQALEEADEGRGIHRAI